MSPRTGRPCGWPISIALARAYRDLSALFSRAWGDTEIAYSFKTNRLLALLVALTDEGAAAEVVCDAEYALARDILALDGSRIVVNGPAKTGALLARAASDGALVMCDAADEVDRAAAAGVDRIGLRVSQPGARGATSRFGIPPHEVVAAAAGAARVGLLVEALGAHVVSTDVLAPPDAASSLADRVRVLWERGPEDHVRAARRLARIARELGMAGYPVRTIDIGGGLPAPGDAAGHVHGITQALRDEGFDGRLIAEPGRALVAAAVDLCLHRDRGQATRGRPPRCRRGRWDQSCAGRALAVAQRSGPWSTGPRRGRPWFAARCV